MGGFGSGGGDLSGSDIEVHYDAVVNSAIDSGIISFDAEGRITSWNTGAERLFGWSAEEVIGDNADRIFTPEDRAAGIAEREFETARRDGRASDERWHLRKDGSRFYAHGAMTPLQGGSTPGFVKALRDVTAEHETRAALVANREKLELALRATRLGQFDFDPRTGVLEWDDRCRELFGLPPGAPVSYEGSYLAGVHPDDRQGASDAVDAALDPAGSHAFDIEYRTIGIEDGVERFIHAQGSALFEGDVCYRFIGTVQDISADRRSIAALREAEQRLRLASRATNDAIWDWDLVADHVKWNEAVTAAYGHRLADVEPTGAWWIGHIHPDDRERIDHSIHAVIDGGATDWADEYRFQRADGGYADVMDRGYVLRDPDGRPVRMIGAMLDQTERKRLERSLQEANTGLTEEVARHRVEVERLWSNSPDLLVVMDAQGTYLRTNPAWRTILGYGPAELEGLGPTDLAWDGDVANAADALGVARGRPLRNHDMRVKHKDGGYRWISWAAAPTEDEIFAIGRDITAEVEAREMLRQTEDALRQSQKVEAVGQLTGGVAHDFNNLLTVIRGSVDLLRRPDLADDKRRRYVDAIADTADRATRLTSQLLAFARRSALQSRVFDVRQDVEALLPMLRTLAGSRIEVETDLGEAPYWIETDPTQFDTAIVNMAVNARDAMDSQGQMTITLREVDELPAIRNHPSVPGRYVAISIEDRGTGIARDQIERIFEPFFTTKEAGHGTGLGLSQVFGFAKQSNGEIAVDSEIGRGTTFTLYLPEAQPAETAEPTGAHKNALRAGACILVVEDNREVGEFATQALTELGYGSVWTANADEALSELAADRDRFDVVFSDVIMPGKSGIELAQDIRRLYPDLPVVLTSGYSDVLAEQGSSGFPLLQKPYSIDELSRALEAVAAASK